MERIWIVTILQSVQLLSSTRRLTFIWEAPLLKMEACCHKAVWQIPGPQPPAPGPQPPAPGPRPPAPRQPMSTLMSSFAHLDISIVQYKMFSTCLITQQCCLTISSTNTFIAPHNFFILYFENVLCCSLLSLGVTCSKKVYRLLFEVETLHSKHRY